jgi:glycerol-3-phosphate acyltransferase PlsY
VIAFFYILVSYLLGSVPFGYLAGKINGIDLREHGSCNIGATNAVRVLGKAWGIPVFFLDFLKGFLPVLCWGKVASMYMPDASAWCTHALLVAVCFATILGHTYTCFLGFKGGKGVATSAGVLFALAWQVGLVALGAWVLFFALTRYVSLASMVAAVAMVVAGFIYYEPEGELCGPRLIVLLFFVLVALLVIIKHRANISRLIDGTEPKAFSKKK